MKAVLYTLLIAVCISAAGCRKNADQNELPPVTQEGKNTVGFLVNGNPWTPAGFVSAPNPGIHLTSSNDTLGFSISAYRIAQDTTTFMALGIQESLKNFNPPFTIPLTNTGRYRIYYKSGKCDYFSHLINATVSGSLTVTKFDKSKGIVSGTFNAIMSVYGCDTLNITEGRFDMKFE